MLKITIDPGHTKNYNKGKVVGYYEGNAMLTLARYLANALEKYKDVKTYLTRDENGNPSLAERGKLAITSQSNIFISLHSNAVSGSAEAEYVCGFYSVKRPESKALCQKLTAAVTEVMKGTDACDKGALTKKVLGQDYYGVIRSSVSGDSKVEHSFIIEHGFHTTKKHCEFLASDSNLKKIAEAEAKVIADYFGLKLKETPKETSKNPDEYYRVQVGAFAKQENAVALLQKLKKAGFDGFIVMPKTEPQTEEVQVKAPSKTVEELARDVLVGKYGSGHANREKKLAAEGWLEFYTYEQIRQKVNELSKQK